MMEKASFCGKDSEFSSCLASFLEAVDDYLDDQRIQRDEPMTKEVREKMETFVLAHLPKAVQKNFRKLGGK